MADLCNACSDWLTVKNVGLQFGEIVPTMLRTNVGDVFVSATFVGKCEQAVTLTLNMHVGLRHMAMYGRVPMLSAVGKRCKRKALVSIQ